MKNKMIEKLIFGDKLSSSSNNLNFIASQLSKIVPSLQYIDSFDKKNDFLAKSYTINLNELRICANSLTPSRIFATNSSEYTLMVPIKGFCTTVENKDFFWGENSFAYFKPRCEGKSEAKQNRNLILIDLSPEKFNNQAKIMFADKSKEFFYNFENPNLIPLDFNGISFSNIFKQLSKIIDLNIDNIQHLEKTRFDEVIYRTLVMMFLPNKFFEEENLNIKKSKVSTSTIKLIKELKEENYFAFMNLTDLENFLDLSTRNLQLVFKKNFEMTPTQFLREQKLKYAKKLILESNGLLNVTKIATETGFLNFSQFAKYYKDYHGILPSETIKGLKI